MYNEEERQRILLYYMDGRIRDESHDKSVIRQLKNQGYLRCGITPSLQETIKTTDNGLIYLRSYGYRVKAPKVVNGRIAERPPHRRGSS